jgi:hypothetical protein
MSTVATYHTERGRDQRFTEARYDRKECSRVRGGVIRAEHKRISVELWKAGSQNYWSPKMRYPDRHCLCASATPIALDHRCRYC